MKRKDVVIEKRVIPFQVEELEEKKVKDLKLPDWVKQDGMDQDLEVFEFKGYASTFGNIDHGDDIVERGAFLDSIKSIKKSGTPLSVLWQHNTNEPLGIFIDLFEDEKGLFVHGIMPRTDEFVEKRVMPQMRIGSVSKMSIGFSITKFEWDKEDNPDIRRLIKLHLWEISLVTIPMNSQADVTEVKSVVPFQDLPLADRDCPWDSEKAIANIKEFIDSDEGPAIDYKKAFLLCDDKEDHKLLIADVIDGKIKAIPRGIFTAAAALANARGGSDIPEGARKGLIDNINRYYEKMGLESPFEREESSFRVDEIECMDVRSLENILRSGVRFSKQMSKRIVSLFKSESGRDVLMDGRSDSEKRLAEVVGKFKKSETDDLLTRLEKASHKLNGGQNG